MDDQLPKPELKPKPEYLATWQGFKLYYDPELANGWVKLCDSRGNVLGMMSGVGQIYIAENSRQARPDGFGFATVPTKDFKTR
jgi:hypothetical protein